MRPLEPKQHQLAFELSLPSRRDIEITSCNRTIGIEFDRCATDEHGGGKAASKHSFGGAREKSKRCFEVRAVWAHFFPSNSITALVIAVAPVTTLARGSTLNRGEWCPATAGPPALAASNAACGVPPTAK